MAFFWAVVFFDGRVFSAGARARKLGLDNFLSATAKSPAAGARARRADECAPHITAAARKEELEKAPRVVKKEELDKAPMDTRQEELTQASMVVQKEELENKHEKAM